ncbi:unnamed protein product [Blepharisma stoltei]|uniref:Uncharacterized protein n=1 Tax=Blepharisma stoltei TaxID=1481888 RepID=A0AAU9KAP0_9CILI|nr:unnamed protein product [Blepharisma stoltei]
MNNQINSVVKSQDRLKNSKKTVHKEKSKPIENQNKSASTEPSETPDIEKIHTLSELTQMDWKGAHTIEPLHNAAWAAEKAELTDTLNQIKNFNNILLSENEDLKSRLKQKDDIEKLIMNQVYEFKNKYEELSATLFQKEKEIQILSEELEVKNFELGKIQSQLNLQSKTSEKFNIAKIEKAALENISIPAEEPSKNISSISISQNANLPITNVQKLINKKGQQELIMPFLSNASSRWMTSLRDIEISPRIEERSVSPQRRKINHKVDEMVREKFLSKIKPKIESNL